MTLSNLVLLVTSNLLLILEEHRCKFDILLYSYYIICSSGAYARTKDENINTNKGSAIEKVITLNPSIEIVL